MGTQVFDEGQALVAGYPMDDTSVPADYNIISTANAAARIDSIVAVNSDSVDHDLTVLVQAGGVVMAVGKVTVPSGAGYGTGLAKDLLAAVLPATQAGVILPIGGLLQIRLDATPLSGNFVWVTAFGGWL